MQANHSHTDMTVAIFVPKPYTACMGQT